MEQANLLLEGKYEILAKIREGGMGTIYKVRHRLLDEIRVIKVMRASTVSDADLKRRFLEEARTAIRLKHPNICAIYDFAADDNGTAYLVMEYIDGITLAELLKSGGLPAIPLTLQIAHQALCALGYLHRRGVIHRDVAPDNLMLTYDEEHRVVVKLIDLGIAKIVDRELDLTATGVFLGKPKYASPEQFGTLSPGERLDGRSDLYGLGVVLYELLTGIRPYAGKSPIEILRAQHLNLLIPFEESDPMGRVAPLLRALVFKALQRERDDRFATADEFDRELMRLLDPNAAPNEHAVSPAVLSTIRDAQPKANDTPTPSAQDRLNKHFGVQATPLPSAPLMTVVPQAPPPDDDADGLHTVRLAMPSRTPAAPAAPFVIESSASSPFLDQTAISPLSALEAASSEAEEEPLREIPPFVAAPAKPSPPSMWIPPPVTASPIVIAPPVTMTSPPPMIPPTVVAPVAVTVTSPLNFTASPSIAPEPVRIAIQSEAPRREARPAPTDPYLPQATRESLHFQGIGPSRSLAIPLMVAAAVVAAVLLIWHPWSRRSAPAPVATSAAPPKESQALPNVEVAPPQSQKATVPEAPPPDSTAATSPSNGAPAAGAAPAESEEIARASAAVQAARRDADDVRGPDFAPTRYRKATAKQAAAGEAAAQGRNAEAKTLLEEALALFTQAATIARNQEHPTLHDDSNPKTVAANPTPLFSNPVHAPASEALDPAAAEAAREEIVRVVGDYAWARHTRNEKLFLQVFPSDVATFRQNARRFEVEDVRLDIQSISFEGARAVVVVNEVVIGTPHEGENARNENHVVLDLQKRGGQWVIVARR